MKSKGWIVLVMFVLINAFLIFRDGGQGLLLVRLLNLPYYGHELIDNMGHNKAFIAELHKVPVNESISLLVSENITAFATDRPDVWQFPDRCNVADRVVIQKHSHQYKIANDNSEILVLEKVR